MLKMLPLASDPPVLTHTLECTEVLPAAGGRKSLGPVCDMPTVSGNSAGVGSPSKVFLAARAGLKRQ